MGILWSSIRTLHIYKKVIFAVKELFFESHFLNDWRKKRTKNISANMEGVLSTINVSDNLMRMSLNVRTLNIGYFCP